MKNILFSTVAIALFSSIAHAVETPPLAPLDVEPAIATTTADAGSMAPQPAGADFPRAATTGFYPIWENTGHVEADRAIFLGTTGASFGAGGRLQLGVQPINFMYRTPNAYAKLLLVNQPRHKVSAQLGFFYLLPAASEATLSPMYTSRLDNADFGMLLVPASISSSFAATRWLELHQSLTALTVLTRGQLKNEATFGYTATAELHARKRHSLLAHLGEVGFWNHDFAETGASYRYQGETVEFRLGYFYRFRAGSLQSAPLIGLGVSL